MIYLKESKTERLLIRKLEVSDIPAWEAFFKNNPFLPFLGLDLTLDPKIQAKNWIEKQLWRYENNLYGHHALIDPATQKLIGQSGLLTQEIDGQTEIEIGYHILPEYWGLGYATEAAKHFKTNAFQNNICNSLISIIDIRNEISQKVAVKNGLKKVKQVQYHNSDVYIYRITKDKNTNG